MGLSESVESILEKIEKLSKGVRIGICVGIIIILIAPCVFLFYVPQYKEIGKLKKDLKKVQRERDAAKKKALAKREVEKKMKAAETDFNIAKTALPEEAQIPLLLTNISHMGQDSGLEFLLFEPALKKKKKRRAPRRKKKEEKKEEKPFYADIPINIKVAGHYHNVALFFDKVARLNRIVNIKDIEIVPLTKGKKASAVKENELLVSCKAITYKFIDTSSEKGGKDKKK